MDVQDIILIDKPKGISSFDVIRVLRKKLGVRKMGHAGTLDPLATGLMIIGVGSGTKKLHKLIGLDKTYRVEVLLGKKTTTGDLEGEILEEKQVGDIDEEVLQKAAQKIVGVLRLPVPIYSAIKQGGVPLYKKARSGKKIIVPVRDMEVFDVRFVEFQKDKHVVVLEMDVASGVYVRSVAEEFGRLFDLPTTVKELRRTKIGDFAVEDAMKIE
ncbi:MAG: tRNA pseudouridine(55) synthase TruB [Candidatus Pacebacteria bacterium]|nr:tRNA pseudouridine(55) synthase TruB [Candidatus Paceibacterota bacterium]